MMIMLWKIRKGSDRGRSGAGQRERERTDRGQR